MKIRSLAAAALVSGCLVGWATASSAATITFDESVVHRNAYIEEDFLFTPPNLKTEGCPASSCLLLNNGLFSDVVMTNVSGARFDLQEFSFHFIGDQKWQRGALTLSGAADQTFTQVEFGNDPFSVVLGIEFANIPKIVFSFSGQGSARLDNIVAKGVTAVPLSATLPLLMGALGGLGFLALRRRGMIVA